ncbi:SDR family NAD(P)-dependent oxidoreductase [Actinosynnema sp. NPDC023587]|uniref:SDR family NAD(P)-dependent oxidoreductase n=1 Tax=Actinosynnema sp. NPDC023587 TaxID=3154695 RepID=UPI0033C06AED
MYGLVPVPVPGDRPPARRGFPGRRVLVVSDGSGLAPEVTALLAADGVEVDAVSVREATPAHSPVRWGREVTAEELARRVAEGSGPDWVFFLTGYTARARPADPLSPVDGLYAQGLARALFAVLTPLGRRWKDRTGVGFAVVTRSDGRFGSSGARTVDPLIGVLHGVTRAVRGELPGVRTVVLDVPPSLPPGAVADRLLDLAADDRRGHVESGWTGEEETTTVLTPAYGRPADLPGADRPLPLDGDSLVLATGGARGVTAEVVLSLASRVPCRYLLVGASPLVDVRAALGTSDRDYLLTMSAEELDGHRLRQFRAMREHDPALTPAVFERHWRKIAHSLESLRTVARVRELGARAEYVPLDLTDAYATRRFCQELLAGPGAPTALLHGAGVEHSRALGDKTAESWRRTFAVKVNGLYNLSPLLGDATRLVLLFGSAAATFGNAGQVDYSGANEFFTVLAHRLAVELPAARVRSVAWPAWDEVGLAVRSSSRLALEHRGVGFMGVAEGVAWAEALLRSPAHVPQVTIGYEDLPAEFTATRRIAPARSAGSTGFRLVDAVAEAAPGHWEARWTYLPDLDRAFADHRVGNSARLPVAAFVELVCQAVGVVHREDSGFTIRDLRVRQPLVPAADRRRPVRITVDRTGPRTLRVVVRSSAVLPDGTWVPRSLEHARAEVDLTPVPAHPDIAVSGGLWPVPITGGLDLAAIGISYGPAFQGLGRCLGDEAGVRHVELRAQRGWNADARGRSYFNIGLLDLALQALAAKTAPPPGGLPTAIAELVVRAGLGDARAEGWAVLDALDPALDVTVTDSFGSVLVEVRGLELTPPARTAG